jgi:serine/threonine protein kinase
MKTINLTGDISAYPTLLQREIGILIKIYHPNVIEFREAYIWGINVHIIMELFNGLSVL